ncbi:hypothetical protein IFM89_019605 [Coptis chinensis]|uniref:Endonuclease/exonuclease/phosphatase domain-containing protein n=1 Tax=Coptis chinensis TaxID=261450 RepID=A0A835IDK7_9MAGN|nr:hypothetical protein IFM89_019605 [Coptis chinensis]
MDSPINSREETLFISHTGDNSISRIHTTPVGIVIADSEAEQVLHLLVKKKQVQDLEDKPPDDSSPQSSRWADEIYLPPGPDPDLGLEERQNKVTFTISNNKLPLFTMRCIFWNIRGIANERSQIRLSKLINKWDPDIVSIAETKIQPKHIPINFLHSLGMSTAFYSNPRTDPNRVPNIWLIWKASLPSLTMVYFSNQHITVEIENVLITIVHAHYTAVQRRQLWLELSNINLLNLPWMIMGDFNAYLSISEKKGGNNPSSSAMNDFRNFITNNQMMEVPSSGYQLTWWNKQKLKRLKGVLKKWKKDTFGNIKVKVEDETKKLEQMQEQFEKGNVTEEFTIHMVDQENQVELLL